MGDKEEAYIVILHVVGVKEHVVHTQDPLSQIAVLQLIP